MPESNLQSRPKESPTSTAKGNAVQVDGGLFSAAQTEGVTQRAQVDPNRLTRNDVAVLQRSLGNRAVATMLGRNEPPPTPRAVVQAKLTVGPANDRYEKEADEVAARVMQSSDPAPIRRSEQEEEEDELQRTPEIRHIQRNAPIGLAGGPVDSGLERGIQSAKQGGSSLSSGIRRRLEPKLNADLSGVKVHTDAKSAQLNRDLGAKAFTHKDHIFYGQGQSPSNLKLTTHEAVHTIQQGAVQQKSVQTKRITADKGQKASRKPAGDTIQRAVGFEFEDPTWSVFKLQGGRTFRNPASVKWYNPMSWSRGHVAPPNSEKTDEEKKEEKYKGKNIWQGEGNANAHINTKVGQFNLQTGPKKGTLHQGTDYKIEPDGPYSDIGGVTNRMDLEIVTEPFPETVDGRKRLVEALNDLSLVFARLSSGATGEWKGGNFEFGKFVTPSQHGFTDQSVYLYGGQPGGSFKPQVTSGVDLADLPAVMETLGVSSQETEKQGEERRGIREMVYGLGDTSRLGKDATISAVGNAPRHAQTVIDKMHEDGAITKTAPGMDKLKGFLSQAILNITVLSPTGQEGIKTSMPLLSRYSLATLFEQVPEEVRNKVKEVGGRSSLTTRMDEVLKVSIRDFLNLKYQGPGYAGMIATRSGEGISGPMLNTHLKESVNGKAQTATSLVGALKSFSRREWLLKLLDGEDLLTPDDVLAFLARGGSSDTDKEVARDYDKSIAIYLRGYGNTKNVKDVEGEKKGGLALFENRNVNPWKGKKSSEPGISIVEAQTFALNYFDWLMTIKQARDEKNNRQKVQDDRLKDDSRKRRQMNFW